MFDIGFWELLVIGLIALIVFGPERLPGLARTLGFWIGRARAAMYSVREEMEREVNADGLRETQRAIRREIEQNTHLVAKTPGNDAAGKRQPLPPSPPGGEAATPVGQAPESAREAHSGPTTDEPSQPRSQNGGPHADRTNRNAQE